MSYAEFILKLVLSGCIVASLVTSILVTVNVFMVDFTMDLRSQNGGPVVPIDPICELLAGK